MNVDLALRVCREVFAEKLWFLLEHGTIVLSAVPEMRDEDIVDTMRHVVELIGPHGGEGTPVGDFLPKQLRAFDGWLVVFPTLPLYTFVGTDELQEAARLPGSPTEFLQSDGGDCMVQELRVGLWGRHKRNLDAKGPKVIARSTDP